MDRLAAMQEHGLVPVLEIPGADEAESVARALTSGGLPCAEVTFRTAAAEEAIRRIARKFPDMLLGAGTVLTTDQVDSSVDAGAQFVVSPGFSPRVVERCLERGVAVIPGVSTPTEIEMARAYGLTTMKFFPAEAMGGVKYLRAIRAPYSDLQFVPTGGINQENLRDYLAVPGVIACGGSWVAPKKLIVAGDFARIEELARAAAGAVAESRARTTPNA